MDCTWTRGFANLQVIPEGAGPVKSVGRPIFFVLDPA
jgi:hypothetical protein